MTHATRIAFAPRVLYLCADPARVSRQLAGEQLTLEQAGALRDDISTDEITPARELTVWDARLGRIPYVGFRAGGVLPIGRDAVRAGGFGVTVAGKRYGKGSSREHSPAAEWHAGIRLVIAESFERIYRQNCDNLGLFTSTDFGLIDRILSGEAIPLEELVAPRDRLAGAILSSGGLLRYGRSRPTQDGSPKPGSTSSAAAGPMTLADKIIVRHLVPTLETGDAATAGQGVFLRASWRFLHEYYTGMCADLLHTTFGRPLAIADAPTIRAFEDHVSYADRSPVHQDPWLRGSLAAMVRAHREFVAEHRLVGHGALPGGAGSEGITHPMMTERYALPGQVVVGTDSHTPHAGALGCLAFGVGSTDMANALVTGLVRLTVPQTLRVEMFGEASPGVTAKDLVLALLADPRIRAGAGLGKVFEFTGEAVARMSIDERSTLTNMTAELGGLTGLVAPDEQTVRFLRERRGLEFRVDPWMCSDPGATNAGTIRLDCAAVSPMIAPPGDPGNGVPLSSVLQRPRVDIAYGGSCTGGKRDDFDQYHRVLAWAISKGLRVAPSVRLYLQVGTTDVHEYCRAQGYLPTFEAVGAELLMPACGSCANCGPGASTEPHQVTVSAINRNFPGRSGPGGVWLGSPSTVAASAIAGEIVSFAELRERVASEERQ